ncbi:hypothetical protein OK016_08800 [Vibrio chagasii]|nr:hypothetical protein [Vibrio chagasii]
MSPAKLATANALNSSKSGGSNSPDHGPMMPVTAALFVDGGQTGKNVLTPTLVLVIEDNKLANNQLRGRYQWCVSLETRLVNYIGVS